MGNMKVKGEKVKVKVKVKGDKRDVKVKDDKSKSEMLHSESERWQK